MAQENRKLLIARCVHKCGENLKLHDPLLVRPQISSTALFWEPVLRPILTSKALADHANHVTRNHRANAIPTIELLQGPV